MGDVEGPLSAVRLQAALSESDALRAEIAQRSTAQGQLVAAAVTLTGLGTGAGLVTDTWALAALAVPSVCAVLGLMWNDHAVQIEKIGTYLEYFVAPQVRRVTGAHDTFAWEAVAKVNPRGTPKALARLGVPILAMGLVPVVPAVALSWDRLNAVGWVLLAFGLLLELSFVLTWFAVIGPLSDARHRKDLAGRMTALLDSELDESQAA